MSSGLCPRRMLMVFSWTAICRRNSGRFALAPYRSSSAWRVSAREPAPYFSNDCVNCRESCRALMVLLVISSCASNLRVKGCAVGSRPGATSCTSVTRVARWAHWLARSSSEIRGQTKMTLKEIPLSAKKIFTRIVPQSTRDLQRSERWQIPARHPVSGALLEKLF